MNKAELIEEVATKSGTTKALVENILNASVDVIRNSVQNGKDVKLVGFGTFTKIKRKARMGHNPKTGTSIQIPSVWTPKFRPGTDFKELLRQ